MLYAEQDPLGSRCADLEEGLVPPSRLSDCRESDGCRAGQGICGPMELSDEESRNQGKATLPCAPAKWQNIPRKACLALPWPLRLPEGDAPRALPCQGSPCQGPPACSLEVGSTDCGRGRSWRDCFILQAQIRVGDGAAPTLTYFSEGGKQARNEAEDRGCPGSEMSLLPEARSFEAPAGPGKFGMKAARTAAATPSCPGWSLGVAHLHPRPLPWGSDEVIRVTPTASALPELPPSFHVDPETCARGRARTPLLTQRGANAPAPASSMVTGLRGLGRVWLGAGRAAWAGQLWHRTDSQGAGERCGPLPLGLEEASWRKGVVPSVGEGTGGLPRAGSS
ncbi:uncharacterized protein LOC113939036 [Zalophus californianus]|uniref:Uncharacterized protein LOC113939036 n=1 Tax=Zalophus californianus TaxID=9704 RepID=A0A6J2FK77_ZALCA|nr:uncharacterized protein LOC113939036 [Zalophus californianus]